jgi:ABC-type molybdate transport system substrate-binding protein
VAVVRSSSRKSAARAFVAKLLRPVAQARLQAAGFLRRK